MRRRGLLWLVSIAALVGLAAFLLDTEPAVQARRPERPAFRFALRPAERARMERRLRERPRPPPEQEGSPAAPPGRFDPLLVALAAGGTEMAVVGEVNALRHSPVGEMLLSCLDAEGWKELEAIREEVGLDPLEDLDRVAFVEDALLLTGDFRGVDWDRLLHGERPILWGDRGAIYERAGDVIGVWADELVVIGDDRDTVTAALDRVEGRRPAGPAPIPEEETYGDLYGVVTAEVFARALAAERPELAERLAAAARQVAFHLDASGDLALVAEVRGGRAADLDLLARSLAGGLAAMRLAALERGEDDLAELLDFARVDPREGSFVLELALPEAYLAKHVGSCEWTRAPEPASAPGPGAGEVPEPSEME